MTSLKSPLRYVIVNGIYENFVFSVVHLTCQQIKKFVDGHNRVRLAVAKGKVPNQPAGNNLKLMVSFFLDFVTYNH